MTDDQQKPPKVENQPFAAPKDAPTVEQPVSVQTPALEVKPGNPQADIDILTLRRSQDSEKPLQNLRDEKRDRKAD